MGFALVVHIDGALGFLGVEKAFDAPHLESASTVYVIGGRRTERLLTQLPLDFLENSEQFAGTLFGNFFSQAIKSLPI